MKNILLIGAGQLGSRHLQSIRNLTEPVNIHVVDPSKDALALAKSRYEDRAPGAAHNISFATDTQKLPAHIFAAVVATNADPRLAVLQKLATEVKPQFVLLEKILFPYDNDYRVAQELIVSSGIQCFVNTCMRMQNLYWDLRDHLKAPFEYRVSGSQFGLITNAIHYLDHACYLAGTPEFTLDTSLLDRQVVPAKRPGYLELNGRLSASFANGSTVSMDCYAEGSTPVLIEIMSRYYRVIAKENENSFWVASPETQWKWTEWPLNFKYQSQLTELFIQQCICNQRIQLPTLEESCKVHLNLLRPLKVFTQMKGTTSDPRDYPFT